MALWSDWTADVAIDVPGCPDPTIERAVRRAVILFLERTHWLARTAAPIDIPSGAAARTFGSPLIGAGERVLRIQQAWINDKQIPVVSPSEISDELPDWKTATGTPQYIVQERPDQYWVVPAATAIMTAALRLKISVAPTEAAADVDDIVLIRWRDAIAAGAKARLLAMPGKQWSDNDKAAVNAAAFESGVGDAVVAALRGPARTRLVTTPHFF